MRAGADEGPRLLLSREEEEVERQEGRLDVALDEGGFSVVLVASSKARCFQSMPLRTERLRSWGLPATEKRVVLDFRGGELRGEG